MASALTTFVLTHNLPADFPRRPSNLTFVTDGPFATNLRYRMMREGIKSAT